MFKLGYYYFNGQGAEQDYKEARKYFRLAAEQGLDKANEKLKMLDEK